MKSILLIVVILAVAAYITEYFARTMYNTCQSCGNLNAKRRAECRVCGEPFSDDLIDHEKNEKNKNDAEGD
ncbi:MAG: hypothetical protein JKX97_02335 [Candidatus Lindowbacteria bacterium]|nr:hypothetical protein [Candidatus Lindowbacteria bacterium]